MTAHNIINILMYHYGSWIMVRGDNTLSKLKIISKRSKIIENIITECNIIKKDQKRTKKDQKRTKKGPKKDQDLILVLF